MDAALKERLIRINHIGRVLESGAKLRVVVGMLEELGADLQNLSGVCKVCCGDGIDPNADSSRSPCTTCLGSGMRRVD